MADALATDHGGRATRGDADESTPRLHALLIGVDCYLPNRLPDGTSYPSLNGCVRDVNRVEAFLRTRLGVPPGQIIKLTAANTGAKPPPEPRDQWPTYENMVAAFRGVAGAARSGDQVYVHYSGHGGRTPTRFPDLKGAGGLDESLVPTDIGDREARYLRDVEIAHLLKEMVDKGLVVTVVFDSCHSGGATRAALAGGAAVRGVASIDTTQRPPDSLVAGDSDLRATWESATGGPGTGARGFAGGSGWLPGSSDYLLLAACRPSESAYEYPFESGETSGALTYWLLDSLKGAGAELTYKQLHDRIVAKVHSQFERQTPQLEGDGARVVFGTARIAPTYSSLVLKVTGADELLIGAGQAHGVRNGAQFAIYPAAVTDFTRIDQRLALAEVTKQGGTESRAKVIQRLRAGKIEQGAAAVLLNPTTVKLSRKVKLLRELSAAPAGVDAAAVMEAVAHAIAQTGSGWVEVAPHDAEAADYQVAINRAGELEILDPGGALLPNLRPALRAGDPASALALGRRLVHLSKYRAVQELDNSDPTSPLARALQVELTGIQADFTPGDQPDPQPFDEAGNTPVVRPGEWTFLRVKNVSNSVLNVSVLDLKADWGISQIFPRGAGNWFWPLDPAQEVVVPLEAYLPAGYADARDVVKVFATVGSTDFHVLELSPLDAPRDRAPQAGTRGGPRAGARNPLDDLLEAVAADRPQTRNLNVAAYPSHEWVTSQLEVRVMEKGV